MSDSSSPFSIIGGLVDEMEARVIEHLNIVTDADNQPEPLTVEEIRKLSAGIKGEMQRQRSRMLKNMSRRLLGYSL